MTPAFTSGPAALPPVRLIGWFENLGLGVNSVLMTDLCLLFNSRTAQSQDVNSPELTPMTPMMVGQPHHSTTS